MEQSKIYEYISEAVRTFPSIDIVVFTGGECFLLGDKLTEIVRHVGSLNKMTRVVSNGYWAISYEEAIRRLEPIVSAGLTEINFSTGDNHQKYVPFKHIENGLRASYDLGIRSMCVSVESPPNTSFKCSEIEDNIVLEPMIREGSLMVINAAWMSFNKQGKPDPHNYIRCDTHNPCRNIFEGIVINPYSQMLSCCGITVEYNPYLKLGSIDGNSMSELYYNQCNDLFKFWLHVDGPAFIYDLVMEARGIEKTTFPHDCAYCIELVRDSENIPYIRDLFCKELSNVLYRHEMRKANYKC